MQPPKPFLPFPQGISIFILNVRHPLLLPTVFLRRSFGHQLWLIAEFSVSTMRVNMRLPGNSWAALLSLDHIAPHSWQ